MSPTFEQAFAVVQTLVDDFKANEAHYLSPAYQETEVRTDFINKLFIALGWDVNHDWQKNPSEQEVKVERSVSMGATQRKPDYAFYIAPRFHRDHVRFFGEAKKPFGDLATPDHCFQVVRYGANAGTPIAVLTSFRQLAILDTRHKPNIATAANKVVHLFDYTDYTVEAKFREIFHLLSREAVGRGSLEACAKSLTTKRGKAGQARVGELPIGDAFLQELDSYRGTLARAFKNRNPDLDGEILTEITQRTLDRLVFLRFLEDKLIETKESVANFGRRGSGWQDFVAASRRLNGIYNGIVFGHHDRLDAPDFQVDDGVFLEVCQWLSDPHTSYDFDKIPIHILGSIYERFLGKVIVTTDKRARVEEKPEVRKAGGVYYTPEYIVRYIVENTVGKLIEGKTPAQIAELRFADIACGSGSFLLSVFDVLLHYHRDWFTANPEKAKKDGCVQREDGAWHLSLKQRREILLNNIYGVDIDRQAVEVAQLSLYLKLLEEETIGTTREYQMEFHETLLPSLAKNIVCGNSLIGMDITPGQLFEATEEKKLNPMDFEDRFPDIQKRGGFDAVIGNPPYIFTRETITIRERNYYSRKYALSWEKQNTFMLFMERLLQLLNPKGIGSLIVPNSWLTIESGKLLRQRYLSHLQRVVDLNYAAFRGVSMEPCIFFVQHTETDSPVELARIGKSDELTSAVFFRADRSRLQKHNLIVFHESASESDFVERILSTTKPLGELFDVRTGLQAYEKGKGVPAQTAEDVLSHVFDRRTYANKHSIHYLEGKDVGRYSLHWSGMWMQYGPWLSQPREIGIFTRPRVLLREITAPIPYCLHVAFVEEQFLNNKSILNVLDRDDSKERLKVLTGVLNSKLMSFFYKKHAVKSARTIFPKVVVKDLGRFPVPESLSTKSCPELAEKVEQMLAAQKQLAAAQSDADKDFYGNKCAGLDRQIDALVYELYGLTPDEIKTVEEAGRKD